jgi:2-C-methyl-D-erythritol 4-phosphate cytidylyltransferase
VLVAGRGRLAFEPLHGEALLAHVLRTAGRVAAGHAEHPDQPVALLLDPGQDADEIRRTASGAGVRVEAVEASVWWSGRRGGVLLLDVLCPLLPVAFVFEVLRRAHASPETAVVGFRPVTDTVKSVVDGRIMGTIDRERLGIVTSPVWVPGEALAGTAPGQAPDVPSDVSELVGWLRERCPVELVRSPSVGRRVEDVASVHLLECVDEIARRTR